MQEESVSNGLGALLRRIVWVVAVPVAGCSSVVTSSGTPPDAGEAGVDVVTPPADVVTPPADDGRCAPVYTTPFTCSIRVTLPCGLPDGSSPDAGRMLDIHTCQQLCDPDGGVFPTSYCNVGSVEANGAVNVDCTTCVAGRRPMGYLLPVPVTREGSVVGQFFARVAALEAASVTAFRDLARELEAHGATASLVARATRAAADEQRHTRLMSAVARRHGIHPSSLQPVGSGSVAAPRSLEALAMDNAVEGCVRETYGALVATWQASAASDPSIARDMAVIAKDETRHAALSWAIAGWLDTVLDDAARARVAAARHAAVIALRAELAGPVPDALVSLAGIPASNTAGQLAEALTGTLWAA